ncbi:MAG: S-methyl-5-thioribose-1-phosphate isomerase [Eggerthellaceae bacterium]|nr:S-methyl-5-thioribose-1-phosphate isomerase [Eggerthellaceae bacterium]
MTSTLNLERLPRTLELNRDGEGVSLSYIDQRELPSKLVVETTRDWTQVVDAIKTLAVRGAPAIGVAGAAALALYACNGGNEAGFHETARVIATARPTAVNLEWAVKRCLEEVAGASWPSVGDMLAELVKRMEGEDEAANRAIGENGAKLFGQRSRILTHCNAGSLATCFYGTALGVVYSAANQGKVSRVYADETRPVGQGSRLTSWELARAGVPVTVICDNMAASLMAKGRIDAVVVGADRIARNGDVANKIGTYSVATLAHAHGIPFYVAAPTSTLDFSIASGDDIVIEQRDPSEVMPSAVEGVEVYNPAFDVTPARLVTKIITETGVYDPDSLEGALALEKR